MRLVRYRGKYAVEWREDGARRRRSLGTDDRERAEQLFAEIRARELVPEGELTVGALWALYTEEKTVSAAAAARMASEWRKLAPLFANVRPADVTIALCREHVRRRRAEGIHDGTLWTELGDLRTVLSWARKRGLLDRVPYVERPSKPPPKDRYLTREEAARLVEAARSPHLRLAIVIMLATGARVGAVLDLTWDRVDFERGLVQLAVFDGSRRKGRATVPMNRTLRAALGEARQAALTPYVIEYGGRRLQSIQRGFARARDAAGLPGVTPHTLRHTAAVWMAEAGVPMAEIARFLGHEDSNITERVYAKFSPGYLKGAAQWLELDLVSEV